MKAFEVGLKSEKCPVEVQVLLALVLAGVRLQMDSAAVAVLSSPLTY